MEFTPVKYCNICKTVKTVEAFGKDKNRGDGLTTCCRECKNAKAMKYWHATPGIREVRKSWQDRNRLKCRAYTKKNEAKPEAKEKRRIRARAYLKSRYDSDPVFKLGMNIRARINNAIDRKKISASTAELIGCTFEELMVYLTPMLQPGMTWENRGLYTWHIDHIVPLDAFDLEDDAEVKKACHYTNLQPLWAKDNLSKNAKVNWEKEIKNEK